MSAFKSVSGAAFVLVFAAAVGAAVVSVGPAIEQVLIRSLLTTLFFAAGGIDVAIGIVLIGVSLWLEGLLGGHPLTRWGLYSGGLLVIRAVVYGWQWLLITTAVGLSEIVRAVRWLGIADTWPGAVLIVTGGIVVVGGSATQLLDMYDLQFQLFDDMMRLEFTGTVPESDVNDFDVGADRRPAEYVLLHSITDDAPPTAQFSVYQAVGQRVGTFLLPVENIPHPVREDNCFMTDVDGNMINSMQFSAAVTDGLPTHPPGRRTDPAADRPDESTDIVSSLSDT